MENETLHNRLETLGSKIEATREKLRREHHLHHESTHLTGDELKAQYAELQARVNGDVAALEAQGHHVGKLERSVREWLDRIESDHGTDA